MLYDFTKDKFDIIIQAGQSNSAGVGFGNVENPYQPSEQVWYLNGDFTFSMAAELVSENRICTNFSLPFARRYSDEGMLGSGRKLLILRTSVGGTGFSDHRWGMEDDLYLRMMEMIRTALALNPENRLVAFLWHQGETDAIYQSSYDTHYKNLTTLINSVREEFNVPKLPFVAGDFVPEWREKYADICKPVLDAIRAVCKDCVSAAFVETDGLLSNGQEESRDFYDDIHFSRRSCYILGERYFASFLTLLQNEM